ncbi:MAG: hypothetical protein ABI723_26090 [Bacteroidia bacterium]
MEKKMVSDGVVKIREKFYRYEFWSDNDELFIKIYHRGRKGAASIISRNHHKTIKKDIEDALVTSGVIN